MVTYKKKILFFSRGLGLGHATRDIQIKKEVQRLNPTLEIVFASYQEAYKLLFMNKCKVIDLGLPAVGDRYHRLIKIGQTIQQERPSLILSDEELLALPLSRIFNIPSILITNYFPDEKSPWLQLFTFANKIIFPDFRNFFKVPKSISSCVSFVGPIVYRSRLFNKDKNDLRKSMEIEKEDLVIVVTAGGRWDESKVLYESSIDAFKRLSNINKKLILLAGGLKRCLFNKRTKNIFIEGFVDRNEVDKYFLISDLVITRGSYTTLWELALLGIPSISIPFPPQIHPFNEFHASNMERRGTTIVIKEKNLTVNNLLKNMKLICNSPNKSKEMHEAGLRYIEKIGEKKAAKIIIEFIF